MADIDKDWDDFMNAAREDYGSRAPQDDDDVIDDELEDEEEEQDDKKVPAKQSKKEGGEEDADDPDEEEDDSDDDDDSEEEEGEEEEASKKKPKPDANAYKPRLKQFFNEKGELDPAKIEKGYIESSKQGVKLNSELKATKEALDESNLNFTNLAKAIKEHEPELAKKIFNGDDLKKLDEAPTEKKQSDPFLQDYEAKTKKQQDKELNDFIDEHPEAATDPEKSEKIGKFLKFYGEWYRSENNGEIPSMKEALEAAYRHHGWELEPTEKQKVGAAAKKTAAKKVSSPAKKAAKKSDVTKLEGYFAKKLNVKL